MEIIIVMSKDLEKRIKAAEKGNKEIRHILTLTPLEKGKYTVCMESQAAVDENSWKITHDKLFVSGKVESC